jgi:hypothetical protein
MDRRDDYFPALVLTNSRTRNSPQTTRLKTESFQVGEVFVERRRAREPLAWRQFPRRDKASGSSGGVRLIGVFIDYGTADSGHG